MDAGGLKDIFLIKRDIIMYFDKYGVLSYLSDCMCDFHKSKGADKEYNVFFCPLKIDVLLAGEISTRLSNVIIKEPLIFRDLVEDIVFVTLQCALNIKKLHENQIMVPIIPNFISDIDNYLNSKGLSSFHGILISQSLPQKYIRSTVWNCKHHPDHTIYFKGMPKYLVICINCSYTCTENINKREMGDVTEAYFVEPKALRNDNNPKKYTTALVELKDHSQTLKLGSTYVVTGIINVNTFSAWNCTPHIPRPIPVHTFQNIIDLYKKTQSSPWTFVFCLASQIARNYYPEYSFIHLKLGLLLSLATFNLDQNSPVPILVTGEDTLVAHRLFNEASRFVDRCVTPMPNASLVGGRKDQFYEAGPLQLSANGVCLLGDWEKYREKDCSVIRSAVESGCINIENCTIPLQCAIWTYWGKQGKIKQKQQFHTLVNIFGMPFISDIITDEQSIVNSILNRNTRPSKTQLPDLEIKQFLQSVSSQSVLIHGNAQQMIKDYFVASRRSRPGCLPLQALNFVTSLSKAHARISLRDQVTVEDVVVVIYLYEASMKYIFGADDQLDGHNVDIRSMDEVDDNLQKFTSWLKMYISYL